MGLWHMLVLASLLFSGVGGSHMRGGLMTFRYRHTNPDGSMQVDFRYKESYGHSCSRELNWNCHNGTCGNAVHLNHTSLTTGTRHPACQSEGYMVRNVGTDKPFSMQAYGCCWITSQRPNDNWYLLTSVDLGTRSDTGKPNSSPVTTIIPDLRVPENCPTSYKLLVDDPDGDIVRCRYGYLKSVECASCYQDPQFVLDQESCTLTYTSGLPVSARVFELVIEDFPKTPITLQYMDGTAEVKLNLQPRRKRSVVGPADVVFETGGTPPTLEPLSEAATTAATTEQLITIGITARRAYFTTTIDPTTAATATKTAIITEAITAYNFESPTVFTNAQTAKLFGRGPTARGHYSTMAQTALLKGTMVTEDATRQETTMFHELQNSLSKIPLQFPIEVTAAVPSCTFGDYRPVFEHPTPPNGDILTAEVGKTFQLHLSARASMDRIEDFKFSGPFNISSFSYDEYTKVGSAVLEWTPSPSHLDEHVPLCFVAETTGRYQSELRCVVLRVQAERDTDVVCSQDTMTVTIPKETIKGFNENQLHLNDPRCLVASNGSHIIAVIELSSCGTQVQETENDIIFRNTITSRDHLYGVITRKNLMEIPVSCSFRKKGTVSNYFQPIRSMFLFSEAGFGSFHYLFNFFKDSQYTQIVNPAAYPLEVQLRQMLYIEIRVDSALSNIELFVESCKATPDRDPNNNVSYPLIQNGCFVDETMVNISKSETAFRFGVEAFAFIGNYPQVYITCAVMVCKAGEENTRCAQGCTGTGVTGGLYPHRAKRSLTSETQMHYIFQGPLRMG